MQFDCGNVRDARVQRVGGCSTGGSERHGAAQRSVLSLPEAEPQAVASGNGAGEENRGAGKPQRRRELLDDELNPGELLLASEDIGRSGRRRRGGGGLVGGGCRVSGDRDPETTPLGAKGGCGGGSERDGVEEGRAEEGTGRGGRRREKSGGIHGSAGGDDDVV